ncbi:hypothetical protein IW261DRAFT_1422238 [Armillaria novae-zelandiae]|uniref:Fungal N-terminal domain-containing protein n=1 Tax=Armillaria novae-zelandiae TaxID=153914 RepID=A0AA39TA48_9AGAR|nr:hypothetical protein IW261DRAFT_1422238 [Armillaria novae-zelandiae]
MGSKAKGIIRPILVLLRGLQATGDIAPLPYIKGIAALAVTVLELVDNASTNNQDIQELVERIGNTVATVNDVAVTYSRNGGEDMSSIEELCVDFQQCLEAITAKVREMERQNAGSGRIMQYLMTPNIRDETNGFVRQVDDLQRDFNTKNILRIGANNEVSYNYLRALECGMRELRTEHSDMNRTLTLLLVSHNELRARFSNQGLLPGATGHISKRNRSELCHFPWLLAYIKTSPQGTAVIQNAIDNRYTTYYLILASLSTTLFWTVSCFTNFLPAPSGLYSRRAKTRHYISPCIPSSTSGNTIYRHGPRRKALCFLQIGINYFGQTGQLKGDINDARNIREFLIYDSPDPRQRPTRKNIIERYETLEAADKFVPREEDMKKVSLFIDSRPRRILPTFVTFTVILPVDYDRHGNILHEEMYPVMLGLCLQAAGLHAVILRELWYDSDTHFMSPRSLTSAKTTAADVVIWSGAEGTAFRETAVRGVAAFISSLKMNPKQSCRELLHALRDSLTARHHSETPQLITSSQRIDLDLPATL